MHTRKENDISENVLEDRSKGDTQASVMLSCLALWPCVSKGVVMQEDTGGGIVRIVSDASKWRRISNAPLQSRYNHSLIIYPPTLLRRQNFGLYIERKLRPVNVVLPPLLESRGLCRHPQP